MLRLLILLIAVGIIIWVITMIVLRFAPGGSQPPRSYGDEPPEGPHGGWDPPPPGAR